MLVLGVDSILSRESGLTKPLQGKPHKECLFTPFYRYGIILSSVFFAGYKNHKETLHSIFASWPCFIDKLSYSRPERQNPRLSPGGYCGAITASGQ